MPARMTRSTKRAVLPDTGRQMDDNIDDLGRRPDGSRQEQPESDQAKRVKEAAAERKRSEDRTERTTQKSH